MFYSEIFSVDIIEGWNRIKGFTGIFTDLFTYDIILWAVLFTFQVQSCLWVWSAYLWVTISTQWRSFLDRTSTAATSST